MGPPLVIVTVLAFLYARFGDIEMLSRILAGITAAAIGLLIAVVAKMAAPLFLKRWDSAPLIAIAAFIGLRSCNGRCHGYSRRLRPSASLSRG